MMMRSDEHDAIDAICKLAWKIYRALKENPSQVDLVLLHKCILEMSKCLRLMDTITKKAGVFDVAANALSTKAAALKEIRDKILKKFKYPIPVKIQQNKMIAALDYIRKIETPPDYEMMNLMERYYEYKMFLRTHTYLLDNGDELVQALGDMRQMAEEIGQRIDEFVSQSTNDEVKDVWQRVNAAYQKAKPFHLTEQQYNEHFKLVRLIGKGAFGSASLYEYDGGLPALGAKPRKYVIKTPHVLQQSSEQASAIASAQNEINIFPYVSGCPNVLDGCMLRLTDEISGATRTIVAYDAVEQKEELRSIIADDVPEKAEEKSPPVKTADMDPEEFLELLMEWQTSQTPDDEAITDPLLAEETSPKPVDAQNYLLSLKAALFSPYYNLEQEENMHLPEMQAKLAVYVMNVIMQALHAGTKAMHTRHLLHNDIAMRNLLIGHDAESNLYAVLSDFGLTIPVAGDTNPAHLKYLTLDTKIHLAPAVKSEIKMSVELGGHYNTACLDLNADLVAKRVALMEMILLLTTPVDWLQFANLNDAAMSQCRGEKKLSHLYTSFTQLLKTHQSTDVRAPLVEIFLKAFHDYLTTLPPIGAGHAYEETLELEDQYFTEALEQFKLLCDQLLLQSKNVTQAQLLVPEQMTQLQEAVTLHAPAASSVNPLVDLVRKLRENFTILDLQISGKLRDSEPPPAASRSVVSDDEPLSLRSSQDSLRVSDGTTTDPEEGFSSSLSTSGYQTVGDALSFSEEVPPSDEEPVQAVRSILPKDSPVHAKSPRSQSPRSESPRSQSPRTQSTSPRERPGSPKNVISPRSPRSPAPGPDSPRIEGDLRRKALRSSSAAKLPKLTRSSSMGIMSKPTSPPTAHPPKATSPKGSKKK